MLKKICLQCDPGYIWFLHITDGVTEQNIFCHYYCALICDGLLDSSNTVVKDIWCGYVIP